MSLIIDTECKWWQQIEHSRVHIITSSSTQTLTLHSRMRDNASSLKDKHKPSQGGEKEGRGLLSSVSKEMMRLQDLALILFILGAAVPAVVRGHGNMIWPPVWQVNSNVAILRSPPSLQQYRHYPMVSGDPVVKVVTEFHRTAMPHMASPSTASLTLATTSIGLTIPRNMGTFSCGTQTLFTFRRTSNRHFQ